MFHLKFSPSVRPPKRLYVRPSPTPVYEKNSRFEEELRRYPAYVAPPGGTPITPFDPAFQEKNAVLKGIPIRKSNPREFTAEDERKLILGEFPQTDIKPRLKPGEIPDNIDEITLK